MSGLGYNHVHTHRNIAVPLSLACEKVLIRPQTDRTGPRTETPQLAHRAIRRHRWTTNRENGTPP